MGCRVVGIGKSLIFVDFHQTMEINAR